MFNYEGSRAVVTGASSGIGYECALQLHERGCHVVLVARRRDKLEELAQRLTMARKDSVTVYQCDLTDESQLQNLCDYVRSNRVDVLVNNAGFGSFGMFEEQCLVREQLMITLNIVAPLCLVHAVIPQWKERRSGALLAVSSIAGFQPVPYMSTYSGTKSFNFVHTLALREELRPFGITVLALCPGPVATEFGGVARVPGEPTNIPRTQAKEVVRAALESLPQGGVLIPTLKAKLLALPCRWLPLTWTTQLTERLLRGSLPNKET